MIAKDNQVNNLYWISCDRCGSISQVETTEKETPESVYKNEYDGEVKLLPNYDKQFLCSGCH